MAFQLNNDIHPKGPSGDQPNAIKKLVDGIRKGKKEQVLLGATGTGKTFTMANIIQETQKPTLILAHNKTLAMQIYQEMQGFFPHNRVEYYVSYFDFFQPEAYKPNNQVYIGKKVQRNAGIAKMRLKTLNSLITERHVIVVASVAAIYGCFNPDFYQKVIINLEVGEKVDKTWIKERLLHLGYKEGKKIEPGNYLEKESDICLMPSWEENYYFKINFSEDKIQKIEKKNKVTGEKMKELSKVPIFPSQDYVGEEGEELVEILSQIEQELVERKEHFYRIGKFLEAERLEKRIQEDLINLREKGFCSGIENYSRYFDRRKEGETPFVLLDYFPEGFLTIVDESHITVPQLKAMYNTNRHRIETLVEYGFRLPSALDNRPLNQEEFFQKVDYTLYVSATPGNFELEKINHQPVEQIIRPTGLLDPKIEVRTSVNQFNDIRQEIEKRIEQGEKVLIYALTIAMSEDIANFLQEKYEKKVVYLHSRLDVFDRHQRITSLRRGVYDVIVGINLLKEGIDLPEVSLVCILDADKPGFLRDTRSLIQIIGRASRNNNGKVILYAEEVTDNMLKAIEENNRRRQIQKKHNQINNIIPQTVKKPIKDIALDPLTTLSVEKAQRGEMEKKELTKLVKSLRQQMKKFSREFKFDQAIAFRNALLDLEKVELFSV